MAKDFQGLTEVQAINKFLSMHEDAPKLRAFVTLYKQEHAKRFLVLQTDQTRSKKTIQASLGHSSTVKLPSIVERKKFKDHILKDYLNAHPHKPQILAKSKKLAQGSKTTQGSKMKTVTLSPPNPGIESLSPDLNHLGAPNQQYSEPQMESFSVDKGYLDHMIQAYDLQASHQNADKREGSERPSRSPVLSPTALQKRSPAVRGGGRRGQQTAALVRGQGPKQNS